MGSGAIFCRSPPPSEAAAPADVRRRDKLTHRAIKVPGWSANRRRRASHRLRADHDHLGRRRRGGSLQQPASRLARLEAAFDGLHRFTADASHELRAPLTLMRAELEGSLSRPRSQSQYRQSQEMLQVEVEHLSRLVDQLLILARADAGALAEVPPMRAVTPPRKIT